MVRKIDVFPEFERGSVGFPEIPLFQYENTLADELESGDMTPDDALELLEWMMSIRAFEQMILALRMQAFEPLKGTGFQYRGPTHLSIGQEATSVGACAVMNDNDYITSSHRGHGDAIAKGMSAIRDRSKDDVLQWLGDVEASGSEDEVKDTAREEHIYRAVCELFGKDDGYCRGRGGGMHIADFSSGHLGANAIVGGSLGIATGAGFSSRYFDQGQVVCCFAGDGAYANGITLESLNMASMAQFTDDLAEKPFGPPVVYLIINNQYGMTGQQQGEVTGVDFLARRGAGFHMDGMHAEVVNGMDVLAVRDAVKRAIKLAREGDGPVLRELMCYRYQGHSLSDPRTEYRKKDEEKAWKDIDPIETFKKQVLEADVATEEQLEELQQRVDERHSSAAVRASEAADPDASEVTRFVFTDSFCDEVPEEHANPEIPGEPFRAERDENGVTTMRQALREAMSEEMARDERVILFGEDVADYGGAFKVTKGLLESFGRKRVFNTSISESSIIGSGVGCAMTGLRPIVELMYSDFEFQAGDQIHNQAAKWHYMSGGQTTVPMVIRTAVGAGKGYGGQHSQALESHSTHTPGLKVAYPSTPYDGKGLLKTAIRDDNPVVFVESQKLYNEKEEVPAEEYLIPFGEAAIRRQGSDVTVVAWGMAMHEMLEAGEILASEHDIDAELIDPRTLIPLDLETIVESVKKTGRCVIASQACQTGSYTGEVAWQVENTAFDYLDAPLARVGSSDAISPQSEVLEKAFLPDADNIVEAALKVCYVKT